MLAAVLNKCNCFAYDLNKPTWCYFVRGVWQSALLFAKRNERDFYGWDLAL